MKPYIILAVVLAALVFFMVVIKKYKFFTHSAILGIVTMAAVNLLSYFTSFSIGVNLLTVGATVLFGLPAVPLMIFLKIL